MASSFQDHALRVRDAGIGGGGERIVALGRLLRAARVLCGLDQSDVGQELTMTTDTISKLERGVTLPNTSTVRVLVAFYERKGVCFYPHEGAVSLPEPFRALVAMGEACA